MPVPYQYSVLRQFDNDPDDDVVDPEHSLNMMVEDTSSDEEEIIDNSQSVAYGDYLRGLPAGASLR